MKFLALTIATAVVLLVAADGRAQSPVTGDVTVSADYLPNAGRAVELRTRLFAESSLNPTPGLVVNLSGFIEGLAARREASARRETARDALARVQDASVDYKRGRFDLLAGFTDVAWGRLDELQPTDVINPLDVSRFFFEGRSQARLPVGLVRVRAFVSDALSVEGVYVPVFRRGRFDQLDEPTSPFNLESRAGQGMVAGSGLQRREPAAGRAQGGARLNATTGRVDWSVSAYRGFEPFGLASLGKLGSAAAIVPIVVDHPRFTMVGADFETVRGEWGVRGEVAAFVDDRFQDPFPRVIDGRSLDAGLGVDRKTGAYRVSGTILMHRESYAASIDGKRGRADLSLIVSADRAFSRERYQFRAFTVYDAHERSAFLRGIATAKIRDAVAVEGSIGWFAGEGQDLIGRFSDRDFAYLKVKYYF